MFLLQETTLDTWLNIVEQELLPKKGNNQTQTNVVTKIKKAIGTSNSTWYMDSGATQHMCHQIQGITKYIKSKNRQIVYLGDHSTSYTLEWYDDVNIRLLNGDEKIIHDVLHVPRLAKDFFGPNN